MAQTKSKPAAPSHPSAFQAELDEARAGLQALQGQDASTGQFSVEHCALMLKYWSARMLEADSRWSAKPGDMQAYSSLKLASEQAGEWEKRKAGAMASTKADLLARVLARLDAQDEMAGELEGIEE